ncbi:hypothetical protein B0H14DRAFT_2633578 [Mycena olivaceomarginata]|nr:hypothetical protein B0H14DRAFT_2633578 [Mycena olivaceomarginata]
MSSPSSQLPEDAAPGAPVHERAGDGFSFDAPRTRTTRCPNRRLGEGKGAKEIGSPWPFNRRAKTAHVKVEMRRIRHAKRKTMEACAVWVAGSVSRTKRSGNTDPAKPGTRFAGGSGGSNLSHNTYPPTNAELF